MHKVAAKWQHFTFMQFVFCALVRCAATFADEVLMSNCGRELNHLLADPTFLQVCELDVSPQKFAQLA